MDIEELNISNVIKEQLKSLNKDKFDWKFYIIYTILTLSFTLLFARHNVLNKYVLISILLIFVLISNIAIITLRKKCTKVFQDKALKQLIFNMLFLAILTPLILLPGVYILNKEYIVTLSVYFLLSNYFLNFLVLLRRSFIYLTDKI